MLTPPLQLDETIGTVIGAALEVHRVLGPGFLETVYEEAMAIEFGLRSIPFERQKAINVENFATLSLALATAFKSE